MLHYLSCALVLLVLGGVVPTVGAQENPPVIVTFQRGHSLSDVPDWDPKPLQLDVVATQENFGEHKLPKGYAVVTWALTAWHWCAWGGGTLCTADPLDESAFTPTPVLVKVWLENLRPTGQAFGDFNSPHPVAGTWMVRIPKTDRYTIKVRATAIGEEPLQTFDTSKIWYANFLSVSIVVFPD